MDADDDAESAPCNHTEYQPEFLVRMVSRLNYPAILSALKQVGVSTSLPDTMPESISADDEAFLRALHQALFDASVRIKEGSLQCPNCQRLFPISDGIVNMLLKEDEI